MAIDAHLAPPWIETLNVPLLPVCMQSTPRREVFSFTCRDLIEAKVSIGLKPEFSAKDIGIESNASAKALIAYCSSPGLCRKGIVSKTDAD